MKIPKKRIGLDTVLTATAHARHYREDCVRVVEDLDRAKRLESPECVLCYYYYGRVGGSVITTTECGLCGKELSFGNTCVDVLCPECARAHRLCRHCGADVDLKGRRKL